MIQTKEATTFEKYPKYKDSGVEWLGEIPESWKLMSNKHIFNLKKNQVGRKSSDYVLLSLTLRGIIQRVLEDGGKFPAEFDTYQEVKKGDFVFCLFDVEETPRCVGLSDYGGMITGAYTVMDLKPGFSKRFLYYFYLNLDNDKRLRPLYTGLRNTISKDNFFSFKSFVPPPQEQTAIANFLDDKTSKIDTAIAQKEQMIALLKERKQIVIQNAVTGKWSMVDGKWAETPKEKMKDSGVEWIGEIPEGWEVKALKYIANIILGKMICNTNQGGMQLKPYLKSKNIQWLKVDVESVDEMWFSDYEMKKYRLKKDDLVLSEGGEVGKTCIWNNELGECYIQNSAHKVTIKYNSISHYYLYLFTHIGMQGGFDSIANRVSIAHLTKDKLSNVLIIQPTKEEQLQIVQYIETQSSKIDQAISLQQSQIEKLKEYKATLIDGAVTGKIRVSG